jgi:pSer/pThr/pTyr-binding forkhead associated (FHA) protein
MQSALVLRVVYGQMRGITFKLHPGTNILGRSPECNVVLETDIVSRKHARIRNDEYALSIEDLGSSAGTYLDGERVVRMQPLDLGSVIIIGDFALRLERASDRVSLVRFTSDNGKRAGPFAQPTTVGSLREIGLASVIRLCEVLKKNGTVLVEPQGLDGIREVRARLDAGTVVEVRIDGRWAADPKMTLGSMLDVDGTFALLPPEAMSDAPKAGPPNAPAATVELEAFLNDSAAQSRRSPHEVLVVLGEGKGSVTTFEGRSLRIGTAPDAEVRIDGPDVRPHHATIAPTDRGLELVAIDDAQVFLNGARCPARTTLAVGDTILLAGAALRFQQRGRAMSPVLRARVDGDVHHLDIGTLLRWFEQTSRTGVLLVQPLSGYGVEQVEIALEEGVVRWVRVDDARPEDARDAIRHVGQWWGNAVLVSERDVDVELTADDVFPQSTY